ncbi:MAG: hypothetical protein K6G28_03955 [Acholeplasmatales bacterium]|nr:hypothetical protein [Acholeplasmatales bacterium]
MKKNSLFIHIILFYVLAFICFFVYAKTNTYNDILIIENKELLKNLIIWFGSGCLFSLICAIPLGRLPKQSNSKTDCAVIEILLMLCAIFGIQILATTDIFVSGKFYVENYAQFNYKFLTYGTVAYATFIVSVLALHYVVTLVFSTNSIPQSETNERKKFAFEGAIVSTFCGVVATLVYLYFNKIDKNFANLTTDSANNIAYIIVSSFVLLYLVTFTNISLKKKQIRNAVIATFIFAAVAIAFFFGFKNFEKVTYHELTALFMCGATGSLIVLSLAAYILRPFVKYIINVGNKNSLENDKYATKEDFILLTDALRESNKRKENAVLEKEDSLEEQSVETNNAYEPYDDSKLVNEINKLKEEIDELKRRRPVSSETIARNNLDKDMTDKARYERELVTTLRKGFKAKLISAEDPLKKCYSDLMNLINNYKKAKVRHAFAKDTLHVGRENIAFIKMSPSGKKMYVFYALDKSYLEGKYHLKDLSDKKSYQAAPLRLNVKSERSMKYALELMEILLNEKAVRYQKDKEPIDYTAELKPMTDDELIQAGYMKKRVVENTYLIEPVFEENPHKKEYEARHSLEEDEDDTEEELEDDKDEE